MEKKRLIESQVQCFSNLGPIPSIPIDLDVARDDIISYKSKSRQRK